MSALEARIERRHENERRVRCLFESEGKSERFAVAAAAADTPRKVFPFASADSTRSVYSGSRCANAKTLAGNARMFTSRGPKYSIISVTRSWIFSGESGKRSFPRGSANGYRVLRRDVGKKYREHRIDLNTRDYGPVIKLVSTMK